MQLDTGAQGEVTGFPRKELQAQQAVSTPQKLRLQRGPYGNWGCFVSAFFFFFLSSLAKTNNDTKHRTILIFVSKTTFSEDIEKKKPCFHCHAPVIPLNGFFFLS